MNSVDEDDRLKYIHSINNLGWLAEERFDRYTRLIADVFHVPTVMLFLAGSQRVWSHTGSGCQLHQVPSEKSICTQVLNLGYLEIPDLLGDPVFREHPAARLDTPVRFYAGVVICEPAGKPIGTLCLIDKAPRRLNLAERGRLQAFARIIGDEIARDTMLKTELGVYRNLTMRDPATGLPGETLLEEMLETLIHNASEQNTRLAIMYLHVENCDAIASLHSRDARSTVLQGLVDRLVFINERILAAGRVGPDRLVLIVPADKGNKPKATAQRILDTMTEPVEVEDRRLRPDINIGVSLYPGDGARARHLIDQAQRACRLSPTSSFPIYFYDASIDTSVARRYLIEDKLEIALLNNQLTLHFQPIWLADGTRIVKFEALARWQDPELGPVSPSEFVPIAEKSGRLSHLLTHYVLRMACNEARGWQIGGRVESPRVAVNIPAREFYRPGFPAIVLSILSEANLDPCCLTLELTEESLIQDIDRTIETMAEFSQKGILLALDDFGAGYSSLNHLNRLPVNILKIDKSFIDSILSQKSGLQLVSGVINIAHGMGLSVVAEGVELEAQRALLADNGCDMIQGYLLGRPVAADKIRELLSDDPSPGPFGAQ